MALTMIPVANPTSEAKRGIEVRLDSLPPGARFRSNPMEFGGFVYQSQSGTFQYATSSRARVRIHHAQADRKFKTGTGIAVTLPGQNCKETDWAPDSPVEFLGMDPNYKAPAPAPVPAPSPIPILVNKKETTNMTTAAAAPDTTVNVNVEAPANAKAITIKWTFNLAALKKNLAVDSESAIAANLREKIQAVYDEAGEASIPLDPPDFDDPIFADMVFDRPRKPQVVPQKAQAQTKGRAPVSVQGAEAVSARARAKKANGSTSSARRGASGKANAAPKATKKAQASATRAPKAKKVAAASSPHPKKAKVLNFCADGCGEKVGGRFKQGHDATYKSLILKVEREELAQDKLPAFMRKQGGIDGAALEFRKTGKGYRCQNSVAKLPAGR